tara:strand:- start:1009 stop:1821 length:813 start_codon:yes stop_codon:yes gene_type:complete
VYKTWVKGAALLLSWQYPLCGAHTLIFCYWNFFLGDDIVIEIPELFGPALDPASGNPAKQLVILCHGVGSDGNDMIGLAPYFAKVLPDAKFIAPNAPHKFDGAPFGYQWFSLGDMSMANRLSGTQAVSPILNDFIDEQLAAHGLEESQLALVGFSQGAMVGLHVGLRRTRELAGIIGYSGILIGPELLAEEMRSSPSVLVMHGDADDIVPPENLGLTVAALKSAGVPVQHQMQKALGHGLDDQCIMQGMEFLARCFGVPLPKPVTNESLT